MSAPELDLVSLELTLVSLVGGGSGVKIKSGDMTVAVMPADVCDELVQALIRSVHTCRWIDAVITEAPKLEAALSGPWGQA